MIWLNLKLQFWFEASHKIVICSVAGRWVISQFKNQRFHPERKVCLCIWMWRAASWNWLNVELKQCKDITQFKIRYVKSWNILNEANYFLKKDVGGFMFDWNKWFELCYPAVKKEVLFFIIDHFMLYVNIHISNFLFCKWIMCKK